MKHTKQIILSALLILSLVLQPIASLAAYSKLEKGMEGAEVLNMQRALQSLGYSLTADGKYGAGTVRCEIRDSYRNMAEVIEKHPEVVRVAEAAVRDAGLEPEFPPVRGGTDGAQLSFRGLPCPNLGTGGYAYHGFYEHAVAEEMDTSVEILMNIVRRFRVGA